MVTSLGEGLAAAAGWDGLVRLLRRGEDGAWRLEAVLGEGAWAWGGRRRGGLGALVRPTLGRPPHCDVLMS